MNKLAKERIIFQNYDLDDYEEQYKNVKNEKDFLKKQMKQFSKQTCRPMKT